MNRYTHNNKLGTKDIKRTKKVYNVIFKRSDVHMHKVFILFQHIQLTVNPRCWMKSNQATTFTSKMLPTFVDRQEDAMIISSFCRDFNRV